MLKKIASHHAGKSTRYIIPHKKGIGTDSLLPRKTDYDKKSTSKPRSTKTLSVNVEDIKLLLRCAMTCQAGLNDRLNEARGIGGSLELVNTYQNRHDRIYSLVQRVTQLLDANACGSSFIDSFV